MTPLAFVDTETTGLHPHNHEIWEVGLILRDATHDDDEYRWMLPVDLGRADPVALRIGQYHDRAGAVVHTSLVQFAEHFADLTRGAHLVGAVISFDDRRLYDLLTANGACPEWHYHIIDVEALAIGYLAGAARHLPETDRYVVEPPWKSDELSRALGVDVDQYEKHTALGDARWARDLYDAVMEPTSREAP